jgi:hypothetical protein
MFHSNNPASIRSSPLCSHRRRDHARALWRIAHSPPVGNCEIEIGFQ